MCLILIAHHAHPAYALVVGANRDEFYGRPTAPADFWQDAPGVLAGRDLQASGTWLGISCDLRFAAVTNFRDMRSMQPGARSRGELTSEFLRGHETAERYLEGVSRRASDYSGFNLFVADATGLFYFSNRDGEVRKLRPGIYGLSNHLLDTPWPKVAELKPRFSAAIAEPLDPVSIRQLLSDRGLAPDAALPDTGVGLERERMLSAAFVISDTYGTRSTTALSVGADRTVHFNEWSYGPAGAPIGEREFTFTAG
ncbi:MAG: NRDE family protein [Burkholderiales bacterium]